MLKIVLLVTFVICEFRIIHGNQTMNDFISLCGSKYGKISVNMSLQKLIVFTRNGDRSPENGKNKGWSKRMCIRCKGSRCSLVHCKNGMLTVKGYKQGHDLAGFIKKEYYPKFTNKNINYVKDRNHPFYKTNNLLEKKNEDSNEEKVLIESMTPELLNNVSIYTSDASDFINKSENFVKSFAKEHNFENFEYKDQTDENITADINIHGYYYKNSKNQVYLKSIIEALEYKDIKMKSIPNLGCRAECLDLRNSIFSKNDSEKLVSGGEFDRIIGSLCNEAPIECGKFNCDLMKMEEYITQEKMTFEDNLAKMHEDIISTTVDFAEISKFIIDILLNEDISIVSVTGETIISLLGGLNTNNSELVPYGGTVFIELWKDKKDNEFYSVFYNGKRMKIGFFREHFVEKSQFVRFLKMFTKHSDNITKICKIKSSLMSKDELLNYKKEKLKDLFEPLVQKLHDKRLLVK